MAHIFNPLVIPVGFCVGVLLALPVGPVNLLGLQRAVERGFLGGMAAGIGIVLGDGLVALGAAMGVNAISGAVRNYRFAIQVVGGLAFIALGARLFFTRAQILSPQEVAETTFSDYAWDIPQTFVLTITNPGAVLGLIALFGGAATFVEVDGYVDALTMVAAVMGGSFCYWLIASRLISNIRHTVDETVLARVGMIAGVLLMGFGALLIGEIAIKPTGLSWF